MARKGGSRRKKRSLFKKSSKDKGKISIRRYLAEFQQGDSVALVVEPSIQAGMYNPRFAGRTGVVKSKLGRCYEVKIKDMNKEKTLIVHPIHLKKIIM